MNQAFTVCKHGVRTRPAAPGNREAVECHDALDIGLVYERSHCGTSRWSAKQSRPIEGPQPNVHRTSHRGVAQVTCAELGLLT